MKKVLSVFLALFMMLSAFNVFAEGNPDFSAMEAEMDLIAAASQYSQNAPESVPGEEGILSTSFVTAFFQAGQKQSAEAGVSSTMLTDPEAQKALLQSIFAAEIPELSMISAGADDEYHFIGFQSMKVYTLENGDYQVIGGLYTSQKPIKDMTGYDYANISWFEEGIFILRSDATAKNGYRVMGYSVGTDLSYEDAFQKYQEDVAVEYVSNMGFSFLYPSVFDDEMVIEEENGVSANLQDKSASFSVVRISNEGARPLTEVVNAQAAKYPNAVVTIEEARNSGSIFNIENGCAMFTTITVTEEYIYQAQFNCKADQLKDYSLFFNYLENSFVVNELAFG